MTPEERIQFLRKTFAVHGHSTDTWKKIVRVINRWELEDRMALSDSDISIDTLTDAERGYLAMHARYESERQSDFRYWDEAPEERARLRVRWRQIADWLHPNPWQSKEVPDEHEED